MQKLFNDNLLKEPIYEDNQVSIKMFNTETNIIPLR